MCEYFLTSNIHECIIANIFIGGDRAIRFAELLNERKSVKEEIKELKERLYLSAKMQEGDPAPRDEGGKGDTRRLTYGDV